MADDPIHHPKHYTSHPSGIECIRVTEWMNFNLGNVVKYVWRADLKGEGTYDLEKAMEYIKFEIDRRRRIAEQNRGFDAKAPAEAPGNSRRSD